MTRKITIGYTIAIIAVLSLSLAKPTINHFPTFTHTWAFRLWTLAVSMSGLWASIVYFQEKKLKYWHIVIALLTLATLIRNELTVTLIAICCFEVFRRIFVRKEFNIMMPSKDLYEARIVIDGNKKFQFTYIKSLSIRVLQTNNNRTDYEPVH